MLMSRMQFAVIVAALSFLQDSLGLLQHRKALKRYNWEILPCLLRRCADCRVQSNKSATQLLLPIRQSRQERTLFSSFYEKFDAEEDEDEEDEEDDDEYDFEDLDVASFRSKMSSMFGEGDDETDSKASQEVDELIKFATSSGVSEEDKPWAHPVEKLRPGCILLANPKFFCDDIGSKTPAPFLFGGPAKPDSKLLAKFGLTLPPPSDLGPDRRADLLPVLVLVECNDSSARAVLLNRRTGYLLGDLEQPSGQPILEKFCIQPLWFGGVDASQSKGFDMLHLCPNVKGAVELTDDGLYWGGDPEQAQDAMEASLDRVYSGFDFKFFVQNSIFTRSELDELVRSNKLFAVTASSSLLFQSRDRMGTRRSIPLWTEIMDLLGEEFAEIKNQLYEKL